MYIFAEVSDYVSLLSISLCYNYLYHSTASELMRHTWISGAIQRDTLLSQASKNMAEVMELATSQYLSLQRSRNSDSDSDSDGHRGGVNPNHSKRFAKSNSNNISVPIFNKASEHEVKEFASRMSISFAEEEEQNKNNPNNPNNNNSKDLETQLQQEQRLHEALRSDNTTSTNNNNENRNTWSSLDSSQFASNTRSLLSSLFCCGRSKLYRRDSLEHLNSFTTDNDAEMDGYHIDDEDNVWNPRVTDLD